MSFKIAHTFCIGKAESILKAPFFLKNMHSFNTMILHLQMSNLSKL